MKHVTVYCQEGRYAGWPANYGLWAWGNEVVVAFTVGYMHAGKEFHLCDRQRPFVTTQARSLDGGETWLTEPLPASTPGGRGLSADEHMAPELGVGAVLSGADGAPTRCPGNLDLDHPDFALLCARSGLRAGARSWFYASFDRCRSWQGPYALPMFGQSGIAARTDYLLRSGRECTLFLTAAKGDGNEGQVFCARSEDGLGNISFRSWVTPEPLGYAIMPASVRLPGGMVLCAVRCLDSHRHSGGPNGWIDVYISRDDALTWAWLSQPVPDTGRGGNPPTLSRLRDGRLCMTYGYRDTPYALCARLSDDEGRTWSEACTLRDRGGNHDLGYPRTIQRPDGAMLSVYYWNDHPAGERYIAATIWEP